MATLPQIQEALENADAAGRTEDANQLADAYISLQKQSSSGSYKKNPDSAGVENIFGDSNIGKSGGYVARVLAQPIYEGLTVANMLAGAPEWAGGHANQLWNSIDYYMDDTLNEAVNTQNTKIAGQLVEAIDEKIAKGEPVPKRWQEELVRLDGQKGKGISYESASKLAKLRSETVVEEYLTKGVLADNITDSIVDAALPNPEQNKAAKNFVADARKWVEDSDVIPSGNTAMNESIMGTMLKGFGYLIDRGAEGLNVLGVPQDTADSIVNLVSLTAGPKFNALTKGVKTRIGYTPAVNYTYGKGIPDMVGLLNKNAGKRLEGLLAKTDLQKIDKTILDKQAIVDNPKIVGKQKVEAEQALKDLNAVKNNTEYNFMGGARQFKKWDNKEFADVDVETYNIVDNLRTNREKQNIIRELTDDKQGLINLRKWALWAGRSGDQAGRTAGTNLIQRMQNTFGKENGFAKDRKLNEKSIEQYNEVIDAIEAKGPANTGNFNSAQKQLYKTMNQLMKEDRALTKELQDAGLLDKFDIQDNFVPRRFQMEPDNIRMNLFGDKYKIKFGDAPIRQKAPLADRVYFKLTSVGKDPIYITRGKKRTPGQKKGEKGNGDPLVAVNRRVEAKNGKIYKFQTEPGKTMIDKKTGEIKISPDGHLATRISDAAAKLNDGRGLLGTRDTVTIEGVTYKVENISRKEMADNYAKEVVPDHLSSLVDSINQKRQVMRKDMFSKAYLESAFGKENSRAINAVDAGQGKRGSYDPAKPDKNIAQTASERAENQGFKTSRDQLEPMKIDLNDAGLPRFSNYAFSKRAGDIISDNFRIYEEKGILGKVSDTLVKNMMINPLPHMHNELIHYYSTLGLQQAGKAGVSGLWNQMFGTKGSKTKWAKDGAWAFKQVMERTPEYIKLIDKGASSMSVNVINSRTWGRVQEQNAKSFWEPQIKNPGLMGKAYNKTYPFAYGFSKIYGGISNYAQYSMWTMRDVLYMQLVKTKMDNNLVTATKAWEKGGRQGNKPVEDMLEAAKEVELHMPTYRLPETIGPEGVLGYKITRAIAKTLSNPEVVIFARYKHGMVSSGMNTGKDMLAALDPILSRTGKPGKFISDKLGYKDIQLGRTKTKQVLDGVNSGLALGTAMYMLYPMMDGLYQALFDGDELKLRRAGILHVAETVYKVGKEESQLHNLRQVLLTINPALQLAYELMMNQTIYNDKAIYDLNDLAGSGNIEDFIADLGIKLRDSIPQASNLVNAYDESETMSGDKWLAKQLDAKTKSNRQLEAKRKRAAIESLKDLNQAIEDGEEDLSDYIEDYWATQPYWAN
jgi:hypothetical protein